MRDQAITAAYESAKDRLGAMSCADFADALSDAEVHPVIVDGRCAGALVVSGVDVHACVLPWAQGKWLTRKMLRILNRVILDYGFATTSATTEAGERFVRALGFEPCGLGWIKKVPYGN